MTVNNLRKINLKSTGGYDIPCIQTTSHNEDTICIVSHGFGSSKDSPTAKMMLEALPNNGIGAIAFDWPCHGESSATYKQFRIAKCLNDLSTVEEFIRANSPDAEIVYFASSFGAYLNLIHISNRPDLGTKSFLRSAAVNMPELFIDISPEDESELKQKGFITLDKDYSRPLQITQGFLDDLKQHDLFKIYQQSDVSVRMIHGDLDETISVIAAMQFAKQFEIPLTIVPGGDHRLSGDAEIRVLNESILFY